MRWWGAMALAALALLALMAAAQWERLRSLPVRRRLLCTFYVLCFALGVAYLWYMVEAVGMPPVLLVVASCAGVACFALGRPLLDELMRVEGADLQRMRERALAEQLAAQRRRLREVRGQADAALALRGRMGRALGEVSRALAAGDEGRACALLDEAADVVRPASRAFCENRALDALLASKETACRALDVRLSVGAAVPEGAGIPDVELVALAGNLLDNAIAAVRGLPERGREVRADLAVRAGCLFVEVENPCAPDAATSRRRARGLDEHGWGLGIVRALAERHGGEFVTEVADGPGPAGEGGCRADAGPSLALFRARAVVPVGE